MLDKFNIYRQCKGEYIHIEATGIRLSMCTCHEHMSTPTCGSKCFGARQLVPCHVKKGLALGPLCYLPLGKYILHLLLLLLVLTLISSGFPIFSICLIFISEATSWVAQGLSNFILCRFPHDLHPFLWCLFSRLINEPIFVSKIACPFLEVTCFSTILYN